MTILRTMRNFSSMNITASILLFLAAISAAIIANSSVAPVYQTWTRHSYGYGYCFFIGGVELIR